MRKMVWPTKHWRALALCIGVGLAACGPAQKEKSPPKNSAQTSAAQSASNSTLHQDDTVLDVSGPWDFAGLKGDPSCRLNFNSKQGTGYWTLDKAGNCASDFPILTKVVGWAPRGEGDLALTDKDRNIVLLFRQQDDGLYASITRLEETYYLTNQDTADFAAPLPRAQIDGRWMLTVLGGSVVCTIDITASDDSGASGDVIETNPCPRPDLIKDIASFKRDSGQLTILTKSGRAIMTFKPGDSITWEAADAPGGQIFMTRGP